MRACLLAVLAALSASVSAHAFVVDAPNGGSGDPAADLAAAARWDMGESSLVETGERGLGGGLEYAIDPSVCDALMVVDAPDCDAVLEQIREAVARWGAGHPAISFVDVTDAIAPELAREGEGWFGHGAEIDFFAVNGETLNLDHGEPVAADTRTYYLFEPAPRDPEGRVQARSRGRLTAADVRINADMCFHLDPDAAVAGCAHFGSVIMHEIAHVLGLDHPDEHPGRNLDVNDDPGDVMALSCAVLDRSLGPQPHTERYAVANGRWTGAGYWERGLTYDDYAGRNALYPACGTEALPAASGGARRWAAFALSDEDSNSGARAGDAFGWSRDARTQDEARAQAQAECGRFASRCTVAAVFSDCFAYARDDAGGWGWAVRPDIEEARESAVENCTRDGAACRAPIAMCAAELGEL